MVPSALGVAGWEICGQQQEGVPQEMGLQTRVGQEGWMHPEDWQEEATHTTGLQLTGRHTEDWQEGAMHTMGLQLMGTQQVVWQLTGTYTAGLQPTGRHTEDWQGLGEQQPAWQPVEQLAWHMLSWGWLVWREGRW